MICSYGRFNVAGFTGISENRGGTTRAQHGRVVADLFPHVDYPAHCTESRLVDRPAASSIRTRPLSDEAVRITVSILSARSLARYLQHPHREKKISSRSLLASREDDRASARRSVSRGVNRPRGKPPRLPVCASAPTPFCVIKLQPDPFRSEI